MVNKGGRRRLKKYFFVLKVKSLNLSQSVKCVVVVVVVVVVVEASACFQTQEILNLLFFIDL